MGFSYARFDHAVFTQVVMVPHLMMLTELLHDDFPVAPVPFISTEHSVNIFVAEKVSTPQPYWHVYCEWFYALPTYLSKGFFFFIAHIILL